MCAPSGPTTCPQLQPPIRELQALQTRPPARPKGSTGSKAAGESSKIHQRGPNPERGRPVLLISAPAPLRGLRLSPGPAALPAGGARGRSAASRHQAAPAGKLHFPACPARPGGQSEARSPRTTIPGVLRGEAALRPTGPPAPPTAGPSRGARPGVPRPPRSSRGRLLGPGEHGQRRGSTPGAGVGEGVGQGAPHRRWARGQIMVALLVPILGSFGLGK